MCQKGDLVIAEREACLHVVESHARKAYEASQSAKRVSDRDRAFAVFEALLDCYEDMAASLHYNPRLAKGLRNAVDRRITGLGEPKRDLRT